MVQATNPHHSNHQPADSVVVMVPHSVLALVLVSLAVQAATNQHHIQAVLDMVLMQVSLPVELSV